jgi:sugar-specific transcriptional regulator TrmB
MLLSNTEEEVLSNLGLTLSQAKVYLALVRKGPSKVTDIVQLSKICREHLYPLLKALEKIGLVERELGIITVYRASPLDGVLPMLVKSKQQEVSELETKAKVIMASYERKKQSALVSSTKIEHEIIVTSNRERTLNKVKNCFESSNSQIDILHIWKRFLQFWNYYEETLINAMARGVRIRQLVELPADLNQANHFLDRKAFTNPMFELRFVAQAGGNFTLLDNEQLFVSTTKGKENLAQTPLLFSNYEGFLGIMKHYFQISWENAYRWTHETAITEIIAQHNKKQENLSEDRRSDL